MRQPVMTALLLIMCFPVKGVVVTIAAAAIGAAIPLPKAIAPTKPQGNAQEKGSAPAARNSLGEGSAPNVESFQKKGSTQAEGSAPAPEKRAPRETEEASE